MLEMGLDRVVRELADEDRLPIVLDPGRNESIEGAIQGGIRHRRDPFGDGRRRFAERGEGFLRFRRFSGPTDDHRAEGVAVALLRDERQGRRNLPCEEGAELPRRVRDVPIVRPDHLRGVFDLEEHRTSDDVLDRVQPKFEVRDDAEVPSAASERPEQVFVGLRSGGHEGAIRKDHIRRDQVIERESGASGEVADPASECQARDAGRGDDPSGRRESKGMGRVVEIAPRAAALRANCPRDGIDADSLHPSQVHDEGVIRGPEAGHAVAAPSDRDCETFRSGSLHCRDDVGDA